MHATRRVRAALVLAACAGAGVALLAYPPTRAVIRTAGWGAAFAVLLSPLCGALERVMHRGPAIALSVLAALLLVCLLLALFLPPIIEQAAALSAQLPQMLQGVRAVAERTQAFWGEYGVRISDAGAQIVQRLSEAGAQLAQGALHQTGALAGALSQLLLSLVLSIYFLRERELFGYRLSLCVPLRYRRRVLAATASMKRELGMYLKGQLAVSLFVGALTACFLWALGVPYHLLLGVAMGVLNVIPYYGPVLGAVPVLLFSAGLGMERMLLSLLTVLLVQQVEANWLSPRIVGASTGVHPVTVILLLTLGGGVDGVRGMLLAMPLFLATRGFFHAMRYFPD